MGHISKESISKELSKTGLKSFLIVIENEIAKTIFFIFQPQITQKLSVGKIKFLYTIRKVFIWAFRICNKIGPPPYNENSVKHFLILLSFFGTFSVYFFCLFFFFIFILNVEG